MRIHRAHEDPGRPGRLAQPHREWVDAVLRRVPPAVLLPLLGRVSAYLMRWAREEVPAAADSSKRQGGGAAHRSIQEPGLFVQWALDRCVLRITVRRAR